MDYIKIIGAVVELLNKIFDFFKIPVSIKVERSDKKVDEENNNAKDKDDARPKW